MQHTTFTHSRLPRVRMMLITVLCLSVLTLAPMLGSHNAWAESNGAETAEEVGLGFASFLATLPYGAVKIAYASLGAIIGGFTYALTAGDLDAAQTVWDNTLLGTYVITPDHLTGDKQVRFVGP